jgi:prolyl-tRNA synthetase
VVITPTNVSDAAISRAAEDVAAKLASAGFDVLLDDRDDRAGVKFKDADLVGIPYRINVGKKVTEGKVELVQRSTRESVDASMAEITEKLQQMAQ